MTYVSQSISSIYFLVRGHSFLPCDRDSGIISKSLRIHDRIRTVNEVSEHIKKSSSFRFNKFTVLEISTSDIFDFKNWMKIYYKKSCISQETRGKKVSKKDKVYFQISTLFKFDYSKEKEGYVQAYYSINSLLPPYTFFMAKTKNVEPPTLKAYPTQNIPVKKESKNRRLSEDDWVHTGWVQTALWQH